MKVAVTILGGFIHRPEFRLHSADGVISTVRSASDSLDAAEQINFLTNLINAAAGRANVGFCPTSS